MKAGAARDGRSGFYVMIVLMLHFLAFISAALAASVSCTLDHPDQDIKRIFPESTRYRVRDLMVFRHGRKDLWALLDREMGGRLDPEYETKETPYTFYVVYKDKEYIGLILGNNAGGVSGPIQAFVAYEPKGGIRDVYLQRISSKDATAFRSKYYRRQFSRLGVNLLADEGYAKPPIRSPSNEIIKDHQAVVHAVRLNNLLVKYLYNEFREGAAPAPAHSPRSPKGE